MDTAIDTIVFDLGGVLVDWNPEHLYCSIFPDEAERQWFLANVCTMDWNEEQDAGRSLKEGTEILVGKFPEYEAAIRAYYSRWKEMLGGAIQETVEIFRQLKTQPGLRFFALTNWSAETFPVAVELYEFLTWFDGELVSGREKIRKPFPEIYQRLIRRFGIDPVRSVYIDDNQRNLVPARALGFYTIHFQSPVQLRESLALLGVLSR